MIVTQKLQLTFVTMVLLLTLAPLLTFAQILDAHKEATFTEAQIQELKNTTSLFVLRDQDMEKIGDFSDALMKVWDFNTLRFINHKDVVDYLEEDGYSYWYISISNKQVRSKEGQDYELTQLFLTLVLPKTVNDDDGKPVDQSIYFCRVELFPDFKTMESASLAAKYDNFNHRLYKKSEIRNWNPGMLMAYLNDVQSDLNESSRRGLFKSYENEEAMARLKKDTLFVPKYVLQKFDKLSGNENRKQRARDLFKKYRYPYKVLSPKEMSAKLATATKETFFLDYVKSSTDKFISIYSTKDGLVYKKFKPISYNLKDEDISAIF